MYEIILTGVVLAGAVCWVIGLGAMIHWTNRREVGILPYYAYPVLLMTILAVVASNRDMAVPLDFIHTTTKETKGAVLTWGGRLTSLYLMTGFAECIVYRIFSSRKKPRFPVLLMIGLVIFFLTNVISPALFSTHPSMSHEYFYAFLVLCACIMMNPKEAAITMQSTRNGFYLFLLVGILCLAVKPSLVLQTNYSGLIPFLKIRLAGFAAHPNGLGVIALVFLLILWRIPFSSRWLNYSAWGLGLLNLLLAQSKTSWVASILCAASILIFTHGTLIKQHLLNFRRQHFPIAVIGTVMVMSVVVCVTFMFFDFGDRLLHFFNSRSGAELATFSGRQVIWQIALEEWHRSPIFGYGLTIWDDDYRIAIHMSNATSAHSQFYQSLSMSGIVGFIGLIIYLVVVTYCTLKTTISSNGLSLAFYYLMISECFSEVPFIMESFGAEPIITHSMFLIAITTYYKYRAKKEVTAPDSSNQFTNRGYA